MSERPDLSSELDSKTFKEYYYLKEEKIMDDVFSIIKEKIASEFGRSIEDVEQYFDKQMFTENTNKEGKHLYLFRKLKIKEVLEEIYKNQARYSIFTQDGQYVGYIDAEISNNPKVDEVEIIAEASKEHRNKGNIPICLEEVLKDIFEDKSFDDLQVQKSYNKTKIQRIFLSINKENIASQKSAQKSGFRLTKEDDYNTIYEITKDQFLERRKKKRQEEIDQL